MPYCLAHRRELASRYKCWASVAHPAPTMFSPQIKPGEKKSSGNAVANWFSSLRRIPKSKKTLANTKPLQKSCIDLSDTTKFYASLEPELQHSDFDASKDPLIPDGLQKATSLPPETPSSHSSATSSSLSFNDRTCSNCCQFTTVSKQSETKLLGSHDKIEKVVDAATGEKAYYYTKKQDFKKVTTTTVTRTTVVNKQNRIGFILSEDGQLPSAAELKRLLKNACDQQQHCSCGGNNCSAIKNLTILPPPVPVSPTATPLTNCKKSNASNGGKGIGYIANYNNNNINSNNNKNSLNQVKGSNCTTGNLISGSNLSQSGSTVLAKHNPLDDSTLEFIDSGNGSEIYSDRQCTHISCKHCQCKNKFKSAPELTFESNTEVN